MRRLVSHHSLQIHVSLHYSNTHRRSLRCIHRHRVDALRNFIGGGTASLASSLVSVPLDVISQLLMIQVRTSGLARPRVGLALNFLAPFFLLHSHTSQDGTVNKRKYSGGIST